MNTPITPLQNPGATVFPGQPNGSMTERNSTRTEHANQRIAHIDDDPDIRDTVKRILHVNGYAVESYQTMGDFLASLNNSCTPDLAILDVMVESMDIGLEAYVDIRKRFPELHMIFMTSLGEEIRPYFTNLSDEWILIVEKPVEPVSLLSIIHSRLESTAPEERMSATT
jgi:two-component system, OmpR family, response regulator ChvI